MSNDNPFYLFGIIAGLIVLFVGGANLWLVEWVMPITFQKGIVKVDETHVYRCVLTEESKKVIEDQKKLEEAIKLLGEK